jgi:hypothetical protein
MMRSRDFAGIHSHSQWSCAADGILHWLEMFAQNILGWFGMLVENMPFGMVAA